MIIIVSETIGFEENLKLRPNIAQCYDKQLLQTMDPLSQKTALASLPGTLTMAVRVVEFELEGFCLIINILKGNY